MQLVFKKISFQGRKSINKITQFFLRDKSQTAKNSSQNNLTLFQACAAMKKDIQKILIVDCWISYW